MSPWYRWLRLPQLGWVCLDHGRNYLVSWGRQGGKQHALRTMVYEWCPEGAGGW